MSSEETSVPTLHDAVRFFRRLVLLIRPYWGALLKGMVLSLGVGALGMVAPYVAKLYIDDVYPARDVSLLTLLVLGTFAFEIASGCASAVRLYFLQVVTARLGMSAVLMFFNHLQHLPLAFFERRRVGEIMSRVQDVRASLGTVAEVFQTLVVGGAYLLLVPPFLFLLNWRLAILSLITVPVTTTIAMLTGRVMRRHWLRAAEAHADVNAVQIESITQIRWLKTLAVEPWLFARARSRLWTATRLQLTSSGIGATIELFNRVVRTLGTAAFTWYGWTLILRQEMTLGDYVAFTAYLGFITGPVSQIAGLFAGFQRSSITYTRMFEYLDAVPEQDPRSALTEPPVITRSLVGDVRLRHVTFGYEEARPILADVSLHCPAGSFTAVVGQSGAGKSSLIRLLSRLDNPWSGEITIDGTPVAAIPLGELRRQVAVVWQDVGAVKGTVRDNLTFGLDEVDAEALQSVIEVCQLHDVVLALSRGLDTPVSEWGSSLSSGQRQRLAIGRTILRETPIVLFDEPTSHLDAITERVLTQRLVKYLEGRTIVLVTHRLATAQRADQICVMDNGRVAAVGQHVELLESCEAYQRLHDMERNAPGDVVAGFPWSTRHTTPARA
ncbi:MAG: peptidase domain-containing ABC transporter [Proteobacteria bacterium]|nr:peptidase domain-containing ABC transporter [Pseudomonadota bacterium]